MTAKASYSKPRDIEDDIPLDDYKRKRDDIKSTPKDEVLQPSGKPASFSNYADFMRWVKFRGLKYRRRLDYLYMWLDVETDWTNPSERVAIHCQYISERTKDFGHVTVSTTHNRPDDVIRELHYTDKEPSDGYTWTLKVLKELEKDTWPKTSYSLMTLSGLSFAVTKDEFFNKTREEIEGRIYHKAKNQHDELAKAIAEAMKKQLQPKRTFWKSYSGKTGRGHSKGPSKQ
jgi:signal recognition particle subunit SEC65